MNALLGSLLGEKKSPEKLLIDHLRNVADFSQVSCQSRLRAG